MGTVPQDGGSGQSPRGRRLAAIGVHAFTASGAVLGLLALQAAAERRWTAMFLFLGIALVVDGIDGTMARAVRVDEVLPRFSGEVLDLIVDFLTYVIVPAYALMAAGLLPQALAWPLVAAILISSAFYFADGLMKTSEGGFRGFPAVWNVAAFLIFVFDAGQALNAAVVMTLVAATFAPFVMVHPFRVRRFRLVTLAVLAVWGGAAGAALAADLRPGAAVLAVLAAASLYFLTIGLAFGRARPMT
ncbi:CDP-alcohol phosphatidyltransferase family protein [Phreatobacter sp.]|uniref:CDP-alcohol phosphatidyltransferase family protein n=1 Tax=Phreatobacter sp. TaxID=1966341 RepID=UPI003F70FD3E